eukprot:292830-Pyramimonas_sp.AAC.1
MQWHLEGSLNVVITDPALPKCFGKRIEAMVPATVLIIGAREDPPVQAPEEAQEAASGAAKPCAVPGPLDDAPTEGQDNGCVQKYYPSDFHCDSGKRMDQLMCAAECGIVPPSPTLREEASLDLESEPRSQFWDEAPPRTTEDTAGGA